ncbi:MAG: deoxyribodipyrimidine photo-lyase [Spirochaetes bacterium]|nr:deoxyribodipyrimidine photo-lyase [Spirochaetota bacterium]
MKIPSLTLPNSSQLEFCNGGKLLKGQYVLLWIRRAARFEYNFALNYSVNEANSRKLPLLAVFCVDDCYPVSLRHLSFQLKGIMELKKRFISAGIPFIIYRSYSNLPRLLSKAEILVTDKAYFVHNCENKKEIASAIEDMPLVRVETETICPVALVSSKEEYSAATFRPKVNRFINDYLFKIETITPENKLNYSDFEGISDSELNSILLKSDNSVPESSFFVPGESEAVKRLNFFLDNNLSNYAELRSDPSVDCQSNLSPYLHFGHISPLKVAVDAIETGIDSSKFLDELIVRRELSFNFVAYNQNYSKYSCIPEWSRKTLEENRIHSREYIYTLELLETTSTHDEYWNAAQKELLVTGKMHNYMRMYWGKKIIEWSRTPEEAFSTALFLNNKYALDGNDPNSYAGVAWCFGKHDRAWPERKIFGKVRYMNSKGLERKFDIRKYLERVSLLR